MISIKKVGSIIAIAMVLVLCIPSVHVFAYSDGAFEVRTRQSVSGFWDDTDLDIIQQVICNYDGTDIDKVYDRLAELETLKSSNSLLANTTFGFACMYYGNGTGLYVTYFRDNYAGDAYIIEGNSLKPTTVSQISVGYPFYVAGRYSTVSTGYVSTSCRLDDLNSGSWQIYNGLNAYQSDNGLWSGSYASNNNYLIIDSSIPVYNNWESIDKGNSYISGTSEAREFVSADKSNLTDFFNQSLPYTDSQGSIVTPSGGELEVNPHFGFRKFDSQVVMQSTYSKDASYQALLTWETDPTGGDFVTGNAEDWKFHLDCTVNYTVGQYPDGNVLVPEQQSTGSIVFGGDLIFDNLDRYKAGDYLIDPTTAADHLDSPYCTMTDNSGAFFVALLAGMKGDVASGNKAIEKYGLLGSTLEAVGSTVSTVAGSWIISAFNELTGTSIPNFFDQFLNTEYYYAVDAYSINIKGYLVGPSVKSQYGVANSDFVTFTSSGYAQPVTPEATESVPDPQPQQPYQQTNLPAVTPTGYDSQGNMTYVVVNIDNTDNVPSIDGNNNMSYNPTFSPSVNNSTNVDLGIDNVADTLDPLVVQENQSFWNLFNPFKDNAFIEATEDYMGIIPSQLQTIFISSFGILIGLTVYRFIRRG